MATEERPAAAPDSAAGLEAVVRDLCAFRGRDAGSDAERRAAMWLARRVAAGGRDTDVEALWMRPRWMLPMAVAAGAGAAASVLAIPYPFVGLAITVVALVAVLSDGLFLRTSPTRLLGTRRATQNVVAPAPFERPVRLIVTAPYDAPRGRLIGSQTARAAAARVRDAVPLPLPGPVGWIAVSLAIVAGCAIVRATGIEDDWLSLVALLPTIFLVLAAAVVLDTLLAPATPGANDTASAVAVALALVHALDRDRPRALAPELVLTGAGAAGALGARAYVRARRRELPAERAIVLAIEPCGAGEPRYAHRAGPIWRLKLHPQLVAACAEVADAERHLGAERISSSRQSGAVAARAAGWPAIAIGTLDEAGTVARGASPADVPEEIDPAAMAATLELCLGLVDRLDAQLAERFDVRD